MSISARNRAIRDHLDRGKALDARRLLKPELSPRELQRADGETLLHQAFLARLLVIGGASVTPIRIANSILDICEKTVTVSAEAKAEIYYQLAVVFLEAFSSDGMGRLCAAFVGLPAGLKSERWHYYRMLYLQFEVFSGRREYDDALERDFQELRDGELPPLLLATLDYHMLLNQFLAARKSPRVLLRIARQQQGDAPNVLQIYYSHLICKLSLSAGLKVAEHPKGSRPFYFEMESLFLRQYYLRERLSLPEQVSLHCFPGPNDYSNLLGNRFSLGDRQIQTRLPNVFYKQLPGLGRFEARVTSDVWLIADGRLEAAGEVEGMRRRATLDLRFGHWKKSHRQHFLGRIRSLALMTIAASGSFGASEVLLAERLYEEERIALSSAIDRAQNVVTQLKRMGFPILRRNRRFFFDFAKNSDRILLPRDHVYQGELAFLRSQTQSFDRALVCRHLHVSKRTASLYICDWKMRDLIAPSGSRYGEYIFVN